MQSPVHTNIQHKLIKSLVWMIFIATGGFVTWNAGKWLASYKKIEEEVEELVPNQCRQAQPHPNQQISEGKFRNCEEPRWTSSIPPQPRGGQAQEKADKLKPPPTKAEKLKTLWFLSRLWKMTLK